MNDRDSGRTPAAAAGARKVAGAAEAEDDPLVVRPGGPVAERDLPRVAIVILNLNGRHHLQGCFESLAGLAYPKDRLEVLLVDNGSADGSVEEMRSRHAWVHLVENERNLGFSAGCNQGARAAARPEVLVFLNNDMRVEPGWLAELVAPIVRGECQATTAKMYSWDGKRINSAGGGMNWHGIGIQVGIEEVPRPGFDPRFDVPRKTLFACGGAMAIDAAVFASSGGFDEEFFAYYEDVDLGWRLWILGHECRYVPSAVCYHHHSSTSRRLPPEMIRLLQVRNPLLACFKNYDDLNLRDLLGPLLALALRRTFTVSGLEDDTPFRIEHATNPGLGGVRRLWDRARASVHDHVGLRRIAAADLIGINDLLGRWDHWMGRREEVQSRRRRADREIFELFMKPHWCIEGESGYRELHAGLTAFFALGEKFPPDRIPDPSR